MSAHFSTAEPQPEPRRVMFTDRRSILKAAALGGAASLVSCERSTSYLSRAGGQRVPDTLAVSDGPEIDSELQRRGCAAI